MIKRENVPVSQILVKWVNSGQEMATWEDYAFIEAKFPDFDLWGQGSFVKWGYCYDFN